MGYNFLSSFVTKIVSPKGRHDVHRVQVLKFLMRIVKENGVFFSPHVIFCRLWVSRYRSFLQDQLQKSMEEYQNTVERLEEVRLNEKISLLRNAKV